MGLPKSGKTCIREVVFKKKSPHELYQVQPTQTIEETGKFEFFNDSKVVKNNPYIQFAIKEYPGSKDLKELTERDQANFRNCACLIYVIDAHEQNKDYACQSLLDIIKVAFQANPKIYFEVFIHKIDTEAFLQDEQKFEALQEISQNMRGLLQDYSS